MLYGMLHSGIFSQQHNLNKLSWHANTISVDQLKFLPQELIPSTSFLSSLQTLYYPTSQIYTLIKTDKYSHGCVYDLNFSTSAQIKEKFILCSLLLYLLASHIY